MKILIIALSLVCVSHAEPEPEPIIGDIFGGVVNLFNGFKAPGTDVKLLGCFKDGLGGCIGIIGLWGNCIGQQSPPRVFQGGAVKYHHNDVIKRCYEDARKNGVDTFAIQNGNECWAKDKNAIKHYNKYGAPGLLDGAKCLDGRGGLLRNDVYHIVKTGLWSSWSVGSCSKSCGGGRRSKSRKCVGGSKCPGSNKVDEDCNKQRCPPPPTKAPPPPPKPTAAKVVDNNCPATHPYAYYGGSHCCKSNREQVFAPQGKLCDGSGIGITSLCCAGNQHVPCPAGPKKCLNNKHAPPPPTEAPPPPPVATGAPPTAEYTSIGCWADKVAARAVPNMDKYVGGVHYRARKDAIKKCFNMAVKKGLTVFAIQDGGWCAAGNDLANAKKYGKSTACKDGKGGGWANNVYVIKRDSYPYAKYKGNTECTKFTVQGCFSEKKSFVRNERKLLVYWRYDIKWKNLHPFTRSLVCTCSKAARANNFPYFAVHYWGECWGLKGLNDFNKNTKGDCKHARGESCIGKNKKRMCLADQDFQVYSTKE